MAYFRIKNSTIIGVSQPIPGPIAFEVRLNAKSIFGAVNATKQLTATVFDQFGKTFGGATVTWSSTNSSVATVDSSGLVTFVANGTAIIRATVNLTRASKDCLVGVPTL